MSRYDERLTATRIARILSEQHGIGEAHALFRTIRHITNQGLVDTVGAVNTGSGRSRLYTPSALIYVAILLKLHRSGITAGFMRETVKALNLHLKDDHKTRDIIRAAEGMEQVTIFIIIPDGPEGAVSVHLRPWASVSKLSSQRDGIVIHIGRFLKSVEPFLR